MAGKQKYSTDLIVKTLLELKGMVYLSAAKIGCHPETIYARAKQVKAVQEAIDCQRGELLDTAETKLYNAVHNGEQWAIQMALKTIGKKRGYVEKDDQELLDVIARMERRIMELEYGDTPAKAGPSGTAAQNNRGVPTNGSANGSSPH